MGKGQEALRYLARYLYRGVLSNANLLSDNGCGFKPSMQHLYCILAEEDVADGIPNKNQLYRD